MTHHRDCPCPRCTYIRKLVNMAQSINFEMGVPGIGMPDGPPPSPFANGPNISVFAIYQTASEPSREELENALAEALAHERYEDAATLRDALKKHQNTSC